MSVFLFSKDVKLRASINHLLLSNCISAINLEQAEKIRDSLLLDSHPIIIIDEDFPGQGSFASFLQSLAEKKINSPKIFLVSPHSRNKTRRDAREKHILYLSKPFDMEDLLHAVMRIAGTQVMEKHLSSAQYTQLLRSFSELSDPYAAYLVGKSKAIHNIRKIIYRIDGKFSCIHINGETGTGKEIVAQLLFLSTGIEKPMIIENCAAFTGSLHDSRLFGHVKGAFTDAKENRNGLVLLADQSVLFLDEIEVLDTAVQGKLLRLLETGKFRHMGSDIVTTSRFKLITASNVPLPLLIEKGKLREDFHNRINRITIEIPPLRERMEDVPILIKHYLDKIGESRTLEATTLEKFLNYNWPGNIRSLFNELDTLITFSGNNDELNEKFVLSSTCFNKSRPYLHRIESLPIAMPFQLSAERPLITEINH
jgi:two-component system, NtrC family, response regulator